MFLWVENKSVVKGFLRLEVGTEVLVFFVFCFSGKICSCTQNKVLITFGLKDAAGGRQSFFYSCNVVTRKQIRGVFYAVTIMYFQGGKYLKQINLREM